MYRYVLVPWAGFEPATLGLEVLCSIQLSYQGTPSCMRGYTFLNSSCISWIEQFLLHSIAQGCHLSYQGTHHLLSIAKTPELVSGGFVWGE